MDYEMNEIDNYKGYLEMVKEQLKDRGLTNKQIDKMELKVVHHGKGSTKENSQYWEQWYMEEKNEGRIKVMNFKDYMKIVNRNKKLEELLNGMF